MAQEQIDVLVLLDVGGLQDEEKLEKFLKRKSFKAVEGEKHVYTSFSTTTLVTTKAFILEIFKEGLQKAGFENANLVFLLNETPYPPHYFDKETGFFEELKEEK
ncbi:hypothetical protein [Arcobacter roscoffensis]|uniref:Uncharacterized protein n=1 Tax=Arcobacter roscoffensis TaxID=2961520 RepID=A0ABY5E6B5_9BACT|nr:hypothetical protein [Arcobacter roscoffensis]UTJ07044.1 hypothetical protein NJU99_02815 [Arcobacter roscoffensis]|tara:strand:+ start:556 stop:867 length:312 start_codon:yes stop_codon:yes gene_type:complete